MKRLLVGFTIKWNSNEHYESAIVHMPDSYDYQNDFDPDYTPSTDDGFVREEQAYGYELITELHENRKRWGMGDMYNHETVTIMSVTPIGSSSVDVSYAVHDERKKALDDDLTFGAAAKMIGTGI